MSESLQQQLEGLRGKLHTSPSKEEVKAMNPYPEVPVFTDLGKHQEAKPGEPAFRAKVKDSSGEREVHLKDQRRGKQKEFSFKRPLPGEGSFEGQADPQEAEKLRKQADAFAEETLKNQKAQRLRTNLTTGGVVVGGLVALLCVVAGAMSATKPKA